MSSRDLNTVATYRIDGATTEFLIPFDYLSRKFVRVTLIGRDRKELIVNQDYRYISKTQIKTIKTWQPSEGYEFIELRRHTSATDRIVDFKDGSILRAYDLNISTLQALHIAEEARGLAADTLGVNDEGHLDARGRKIVNVANPTSDRDAVNFKFLDETEKSITQSLEEVRRLNQDVTTKHGQVEADTQEVRQAVATANEYKTASELARDRAESANSLAQGHANITTEKASEASLSAQTASLKEVEASNHADRAKREADRAENQANIAVGGAIPKVNLVQTTGDGSDKVMSQASVTQELNKKFDVENMRVTWESSNTNNYVYSTKYVNYLYNKTFKHELVRNEWDEDVNGIHVYSSKYINESHRKMIPKENLVQTTGQSVEHVMSQKAVTDALGGSWEKIYTGSTREYRWKPEVPMTGSFEFVVQFNEDWSEGVRFNRTANKGFCFYDPDKQQHCYVYVSYGISGKLSQGTDVFPTSDQSFIIRSHNVTMTSIWIRRL